MPISRRSLIHGAATLALASILPAPARAEEPLTPDEALEKLRAGYRSFDQGRLRPYRIDKPYIAGLYPRQKPFATIVCCSDSRVGPEQIFQAGLGELFVVRNAGTTVANPQALGSIEYSVADLAVPLIVVFGHTQCGAVKEAINIVKTDKPFPPTLEAMLLPLLPAALATREQQGDWIDNAVRENVRRIARTLRSPTQPILYPPQARGALKVICAIYDLKKGKVEFFDP